MTAIIEQNPDLVLDQSADDYWNHYQLTFALYSVSDRAIPSAFDGLKPGQRRLLYQMHDSRLLPGNKPQKSSKVCSAVTGNLHPHGGASMYGAAALMAAEFQRVKVIDGQGAFPRIQGDIPAADRYTEMRLSAPGAALTAELDDHAVPMVPTFDGEWTEPTVLPAQWPVLLCNGAVGIAEGWATKVPAHNPREVMAACRALLKTPNMTDDRLVKLIPGPDWGCGATVVGTAGLREYITTGRAAFTVRGTVSVDGKNVVITELPPGVASNTVQEQDPGPGRVRRDVRCGRHVRSDRPPQRAAHRGHRQTRPQCRDDPRPAARPDPAGVDVRRQPGRARRGPGAALVVGA